MVQKSRVVYAGCDVESEKRLQHICDTNNWILQKFCRVSDFVEHMKNDPFPDEESVAFAKLKWLDRHLAPVVVDVDCSESSSLETVLEIKSIHAAFPVIVIGVNVSLASFSVAQMDGADAMFFKPIDPIKDLPSLSDTIIAGFDRIARWRTAFGSGPSFCSVAETSTPNVVN